MTQHYDPYNIHLNGSDLDQKQSDQLFIAKLVGELEQQNQCLDSEILKRLATARSAAIRSKTPREKNTRRLSALAASITLLAITIWWSPSPNRQQDDPIIDSDATAQQLALQLEDLALLSTAQDLNMIEELEFYRWLEQQNLLTETKNTIPESS